MRTAGLVIASLLASGCATMSTARALKQGETQVGVTLGGPLSGSATRVVPNTVVEGRFGLPALGTRPHDVSVGWNAMPVILGVFGGHVGWAVQLLDPDGARPAVTTSTRLFVYADASDLYLLDEIDVTVSWDAGPHVVYLGLSEGIELSAPGLILSPSVGVEIALGRIRLQVEANWWGANRRPELHDVGWLSPGTGVIGLHLGVAVPLGRSS